MTECVTEAVESEATDGVGVETIVAHPFDFIKGALQFFLLCYHIQQALSIQHKSNICYLPRTWGYAIPKKTQHSLDY